MSEFNLFSENKTKEIAERSQFKFSGGWLFIFSFLLLVILLSTATFVMGLYYNNQMTDKGNALIQLRKEQSSKYTDTINSINDYNARNAASAQIVKDQVLPEKIVAEVEKSTGATVTSYIIDVNNGSIAILGIVPTIEDGVTVSENLKKDDLFNNVKLDEIYKNDLTNNYTYNILISFKREKVQS